MEELERENLDSRKIEDLILDVESKIEEKFFYKKIPLSVMNTVIEDASFDDIRLGYFTFFNAFFNNQYRWNHSLNTIWYFWQSVCFFLSTFVLTNIFI